MRIILLALPLVLLLPSIGTCDSWKIAQEKKKAQLDLYWFTSKPFIYADAQGNLGGLEFELIETFVSYAQEKHGIYLQLNWIEDESFYSIIESVGVSSKQNTWGVSAFSTTDERKKILNYTNSYLPDITVLVSSQGTPIVQNFDEINKMMEGMHAISIKGTIYETLLFKMKDQLTADFEIEYITSSESVLDHISRSDNAFGFIDLPVYMMWIKDGRNLTRQNFFTFKGVGYGFIMPLSSDWYMPFNAFLTDPDYSARIASVISKHLGRELHSFIDESYDREQLATYILTKEKEIQLELIKNANLNLEKEITYKRILVLGIAIILIFFLVTIYFFRKNQKTTALILAQKNQIESHEKSIRQKNEQLINRNAQLLNLNEDKNNLVSILAHDLRSPLSNIIGLSGIIRDDNTSTKNNHSDYLEKISEAANHMNQMIVKILDVGTLDRNQKTVITEQVDIHSLITDLSSRYKPLATNKSIVLDIISPNKEMVIETDHMLLFLILENLLSNAVKFSPAESRVVFEVVESDGNVKFKVIDEGPGFTEKDKTLVFNKFQKLSARPTGNEPSTGLGLSIVKKYVTDLGGKVWMESEVGKGSTFYVCLNG